MALDQPQPLEDPTPLYPPPPQRPEPTPPPPAARRGIAALLVATFIAGAIAGGVAGAWTSELSSRSPLSLPTLAASPVASTVTFGDGSALESAVSAILPAVVTVENNGNSGVTVGTGSGVIIDKDLGYIVTNSHVVEQSRTTDPARFVDVILSDGTKRDAIVVGNDPSTDIAVLKVPGGGLPAQATLADISQLPLGAQVVAIGSPGISAGRGQSSVLQNTVTSGIVSGKGRQFPRADLRNVTLNDLIQTDAAINPGNSGGPLVWVATKQVIGLNTLVVRGSGEEGLGFAVSSQTVRDVAAKIIARGSAN